MRRSTPRWLAGQKSRRSLMVGTYTGLFARSIPPSPPGCRSVQKDLIRQHISESGKHFPPCGRTRESTIETAIEH